MLCVASFLVLLVASAFSARHRKLLKQSSSCVFRKATLRSCDTTFAQDVRTAALAPLALKAPRLVRPASAALTVTAWVTVFTLLFSTYAVVRGGLNLIAYGTCDKQNPQACLLTGNACTVASDDPSFWQSLTSGDVVGAVTREATALADTVSTISGRFRSWDGADFVPEYASFAGGYQPGLPVVVEVIDPGCAYCGKLSAAIAEAGLTETANVTYLVYPILWQGDPQFPHSTLVAQYLTAIRVVEHDTDRAADPTDWAILREIFTGSHTSGVDWQTWLNDFATTAEATEQLHAWLAESGYDDDGIAEIAALASSGTVADLLDETRRIVEDDIRTVTIPTLIADGGLHRGLLSVERLREMGAG